MNTEGVSLATAWFESWFESEHYLNLYSHRDKTDAMKLINFLRSEISITPGARILDLGCGPGRHSLIFASEGFNVTGFDLSNRLLQAASLEKSLEKSSLALVRGDIRNLPFKGGFDLVMSIFTSWGYFIDDHENFQVLRDALALRKDEGYFILDLLNPAFLREHLIPSDTIFRNGVTYDISREIESDRVVKTISFFDGVEFRVYKESVRLYSAEEITSVLEDAGASKLTLYGDYNGTKFSSSSSPRLICIAS